MTQWSKLADLVDRDDRQGRQARDELHPSHLLSQGTLRKIRVNPPEEAFKDLDGFV
jgi:hypothetical protein